MADYDIAVPTIGRPSLSALLTALADGDGPGPAHILLVDDRPESDDPLPVDVPPALADTVKIVRGRAAGPAAARNVAWRASDAEWVAFLDDDVVPDADWPARLAADLADLPPEVAGSQGSIRVPRPTAPDGTPRRPTDWERNTTALEGARWATADLAYRRAALAAVGGFDERFARAYREDADLGLRIVASGRRIVTGSRTVTHPVRPADRWVSIRAQAGNADDPVMRARHGRSWRADAAAPPGRRRRHLATTTAGLVGLAGLVARRRGLALAGLAGWALGTGELAWARIAPGPRDRDEVATMLATSAALPPAATWHWLRGLAAARGTSPCRRDLAKAVLCDRDGTLIEDVGYNGDPDLVRPRPGVIEGVQRLRQAGCDLAVITNQSGVGRGVLTGDQVDAVNRRVEDHLGPLGPWLVCPHAPAAGCDCRKPAAGLVTDAARALGHDPGDCVVIGDIGADVEAARAAGARSVLVPTGRTRDEEIAAAPVIAPSFDAAVLAVLEGRA